MTVDIPPSHSYDLRSYFLETPSGRIFVISLIPRGDTRCHTAVIALPPFAEEMNKARRMLSLQGHRLAGEGVTFVLPDLFGTGDSEGIFAQSDWTEWCANVRLVAGSIIDSGIENLRVLALRSGVFLMPGLVDSLGRNQPDKIVLWNPVQRGSKMIDQLFRSKVIRDRASAEPVSVANIRQEIGRVGSVDVAGYRITDTLLQDVDRLVLSDLTLPEKSEVLWIDVSPVKADTVPPAAKGIIDKWSASGNEVSYAREVGPQFWMGPEIEVLPDLITQSTNFLLAN